MLVKAWKYFLHTFVLTKDTHINNEKKKWTLILRGKLIEAATQWMLWMLILRVGHLTMRLDSKLYGCCECCLRQLFCSLVRGTKIMISSSSQRVKVLQTLKRHGKEEPKGISFGTHNYLVVCHHVVLRGVNTSYWLIWIFSHTKISSR